ncbi:MAG: flagellar hook-length control protein FliK [Desulfobacula sp.]|uniref:flagellar hook-length control protein FliK n=1 Tax=Desulfobacula sp. TaxID=2593537 RepID=UPI0025BDE0EB|nr:flagellar hook-length control protein FliK [Desulfobacula sp.]MCD4722030.1 flagellar hook-length control protein FliK [Desulfobacula sp.]
MDFIFADVNNSFSNMIQQDLPREVMFNGNDAGSQKQSFAENLSKTLEKIEHHENGVLLQIQSGQIQSDQTKSIQANLDQPIADSSIESLSGKLSREKGIGFVLALKNIFLMLSKGDLKNISIDSDGIEALKKMLLKAGFKESEINDLMAGLSEELENKNLTLDDLLDKLFDLPLEAKLETQPSYENFLEISAIPFIESILNSLGISRETIQDILSAADKGEKGISLDVIIQKLQTLQKQSFYTQDHYQTRKDDNNFKMLFKQLDLEQNESKPSVLTLDEFVSSLEKLRQKISQQQAPTEVPSDNDQKFVANEKPFDLFSALFKGLEFKNKAPEIQAFEFSYEQIRDQFKNELFVPVKSELFVPGKDKASKKDLFSLKSNTVKHPTDIKLENAFKEMESLLGGKKTGTVDMNDQLKESKEFLEQLKSGSGKLSDQNQMLTSDAKINEMQSSIEVLKTKSSFKNLPAYVTHQVSKSLVRAINQGENILKIQLNPPELGRLVMTIDNTGSSMKVNIMTENLAAKEILISNVNELRTVLSNSGVNLERVEVDMSSDFKQSMADARNQAGNFGKQNRSREKLSFDPVSGEEKNDLISLLDAVNQGRSLHFVA